MAVDMYFETLCATVAGMSKAEVKRRILHFEGPIRLDFTEDYLNSLDLERLRHILLAALITAHRKCAS
jgi:hypothetical protein